MNEKKTTVFLAEGERHVLEALRLVLEQQTDFEIRGETQSAESLLARTCQLSPDVILLDWNLPGFNPQRLVPALCECCPSAKLVALIVKPEHEKVIKDYGLKTGLHFINLSKRPEDMGFDHTEPWILVGDFMWKGIQPALQG